MTNNQQKEGGGVFVGATVPAETASKIELVVAAMTGGKGPIQSKSDLIRTALADYLDRMKPSPIHRMVSHLLGNWHSSQAQSDKRIPFKKYLEQCRADLLKMGVSSVMAQDVCKLLEESIPVEAQ